MKTIHTLAALAATTMAANAANIALGSIDVDDFTTSAWNFEGVTTNTSVEDSGLNLWNANMVAGPNFTIGHVYLADAGFDLSNTAGGIEDLTFRLNTTAATSVTNWRPIIAIDGTVYTLAGNLGNPGNMNGNDLNTFGGSLGSSTQWANLLSTASSLNGVDGSLDPDFSATSGTLQVGFMQWAGSTGGSINSTHTVGLEEFSVNVEFTAVPEPSSTALLGLGGLALILRRRK